jgi:hypothetical protein
MSFPVYIHFGALRRHPHGIFETLAHALAFRMRSVKKNLHSHCPSRQPPDSFRRLRSSLGWLLPERVPVAGCCVRELQLG